MKPKLRWVSDFLQSIDMIHDEAERASPHLCRSFFFIGVASSVPHPPALWDALTGRIGTVNAEVEVKKPAAARNSR